MCRMLCFVCLYDMSTNLMLHQKLPSGLIINFELDIYTDEKWSKPKVIQWIINLFLQSGSALAFCERTRSCLDSENTTEI